MKNIDTNKIEEPEKDGLKEKKITRKDAIRKTGYIAISAATMMLLLSNPQKAQGQESSPPPPDIW
jgi:hypothetical protein